MEPAAPAVFFQHQHSAVPAAVADWDSSQKKENFEAADAFAEVQEAKEEVEEEEQGTFYQTLSHCNSNHQFIKINLNFEKFYKVQNNFTDQLSLLVAVPIMKSIVLCLDLDILLIFNSI